MRQLPRVVAGGLAAVFLLGAVSTVPRGTRVIYQSRSKYNDRIIVREDAEGLRYLMFSDTGGHQTVRRPGDVDRLELPYSKVMLAGLALAPEPRRILVLGLGGGAIPSFLHKRYPRTRIDCVEIDPAVVEVAKKFFGFKENAYLRVFVVDGRKFIERSRHVYDAIFLDAYGDDALPVHLATREFLLAVRSTCHPRGVVLGNIWDRLSNELYDSMVRTYEAVFEQLYLLRVPARANVILVAVGRPGELSAEKLAREAREIAAARDFGYDVEQLVLAGFRDTSEIDPGAPILEDRLVGY